MYIPHSCSICSVFLLKSKIKIDLTRHDMVASFARSRLSCCCCLVCEFVFFSSATAGKSDATVSAFSCFFFFSSATAGATVSACDSKLLREGATVCVATWVVFITTTYVHTCSVS